MVYDMVLPKKIQVSSGFESIAIHLIHVGKHNYSGKTGLANISTSEWYKLCGPLRDPCGEITWEGHVSICFCSIW